MGQGWGGGASIRPREQGGREGLGGGKYKAKRVGAREGLGGEWVGGRDSST